jgi:hypothetical protein
VNKKKVVVTAAAVMVAGACGFFAYTHKAPVDSRTAAAAEKSGVVNPDAKTIGMKTEPLPQVSEKRFEPPPPISTGSYTDPKYRKKPEAKTDAG